MAAAKLLKRRLLRKTAPAVLVRWESVSNPSGWTWSLPITIQRNGRRFRVPGFNIQTRANISVSKSYYVDAAGGSDSNTGLSWAQAYATVKKALEQVDVDRVYVKAGWYYYNQVQPFATRDVEIIGVEPGVYLTSDFRNQLGAWSQSANYYYQTFNAQTAARVMDHSNLDSYGADTPLTLRASSAEVNDNANSWYQDGTYIYIRTFDSRAPDTNLRYLSALVWNITADNRKVYCEAINFQRLVQVRNNSATGGMKFYAKSCTFMGLIVAGVTEVILQGCTAFKSPEDGFNYDDRNGVKTQAIEIDCTAYNLGAGSSDQASTIHATGEIVRINGNYHHSYGQNVADVGTGKSWNLGCTFEASDPGGIGLHSARTTWLDRCQSRGQATYDLQNTGGTTIYKREFYGAKGVNDIAGTLSDY